MSFSFWTIEQSAAHLPIVNALLVLWSAYVIGLLIPGPNLVALAGLVTLRGFTASLPMALGISVGSFLQAATLLLGISLIFQGDSLHIIGRSIGALILIGLGVHLWQGSTATINLDDKANSRGSMHFFAGVSTGICNPISFAGIAAQLLGSASILLGTRWGLIAAAGVGLLSLIRSLLVALAFEAAGARRVAAGFRRPVSILVASAFILMGINLAWPVAPNVVALARATLAQPQPALKCSTAGVSVVGSSSSTAERVCSAVSMAAPLLARCHLKVEHGARIHIFENLQASGRQSHGQYLPETRRISIVDETLARQLQLAQPEYAPLSFETFYAGLVTHELAHLTFEGRTSHLQLPMGAHEYVAYAFQIASFPRFERSAFLARFPSVEVPELNVFGPMLAVVNPAHFAALAYRHFAAPANGCAFVDRLRSGLETFPPDSAE